MSFKCKIGLHSWNGCTCSECEKTRDEQHVLDGCKCTQCGKTVHDWHSESFGCTRCGKVIEIDTLDDLQAINNNLQAHYLFVADIDAIETKNWNSGMGFVPIGSTKNPFMGLINGNNHTISNLNINRPNEVDIGLFGSLWRGTVNRLVLSSVTIKGLQNVGGLIGLNCRSNISECQSSGKISGKDDIGGLVGRNIVNSMISDCLSLCEVSGNRNIGGLVGDNVESRISECLSACHVDGNMSVGGLVGWNTESNISECLSSGKISGIHYVGGLVGWNTKSSISECLSTCDVDGRDSIGGLVGINFEKSNISECHCLGKIYGEEYAGGLVGWNRDKSLISDCLSICEVSGNESVGGLVGRNEYKSSINKSYWEIQTSEIQISHGTGMGKSTIEMKQRNTYVDWDFDNKWQIDEGKSYPALRCIDKLKDKFNIKQSTFH